MSIIFSFNLKIKRKPDASKLPIMFTEEEKGDFQRRRKGAVRLDGGEQSLGMSVESGLLSFEYSFRTNSLYKPSPDLCGAFSFSPPPLPLSSPPPHSLLLFV